MFYKMKYRNRIASRSALRLKMNSEKCFTSEITKIKANSQTAYPIFILFFVFPGFHATFSRLK